MSHDQVTLSEASHHQHEKMVFPTKREKRTINSIVLRNKETKLRYRDTNEYNYQLKSVHLS